MRSKGRMKQRLASSSVGAQSQRSRRDLRSLPCGSRWVGGEQVGGGDAVEGPVIDAAKHSGASGFA